MRTAVTLGNEIKQAHSPGRQDRQLHGRYEGDAARRGRGRLSAGPPKERQGTKGHDGECVPYHRGRELVMVFHAATLTS